MTVPTLGDLEIAMRVIRDYLPVTPVAALDLRGGRVLAKLENLQRTGSFKVRGGLAAVSAAREEDPTGAVISASAGNHGLGVAYAATKLGVRATVVVPANASVAKVKKLKTYDIELIQHGATYDEAQTEAMRIADERSVRYVSPFNDTHVIAGQSTLFSELFDQVPDLQHVVVPVGGGGLISGAILAREAAGLHGVKITAVQPQNSCAMYHVLHGTPMNQVLHEPTIADGLAGGGDEGALTNDLIARNKIEFALVPESEIHAGVREAALVSGLVLEGSGATPYAAITNGLITEGEGHMAFIASGRNIAPELFVEILAEG